MGLLLVLLVLLVGVGVVGVDLSNFRQPPHAPNQGRGVKTHNRGGERADSTKKKLQQGGKKRKKMCIKLF